MPTHKNKNQFDVIVIGGGPAGMMAAGRAAELGASVLLIEKTYRLGSKLLLTGGGKCNITNNADLPEMIAAFGQDGKFLYRALTSFSNNDLINFFSQRGVPMQSDSEGRVLPKNNDANAILAVLRTYLKKHNVQIIYNMAATKINSGSKDKKNIKSVTLSDGSIKKSTNLIIATGGKSYPQTGSTGDGYELAKLCGHTIVPLSPGLSALKSNHSFIKDLQGLTLKDITISVIIDGSKKYQEKGNILFTHFGVSGPVVLNLSGKIIDALTNKSIVELSLNLKPDKNIQEFDKLLQKEFITFGARTVAQYFNNTLPSSLAGVLKKYFSSTADKQCSMVSRNERKTIAAALTDLRIPITGSRPIKEAMITRGGVSLKELNPQTMESRLVLGLYFCGELINLAGITGGYNLQEAFSTGYLAGQSAALQIKSP